MSGLTSVQVDAAIAAVIGGETRTTILAVKGTTPHPLRRLTRVLARTRESQTYIKIGYSSQRRTLLVVHTEHEIGEEILIRIISSRKATTRERKTYEESSK